MHAEAEADPEVDVPARHTWHPLLSLELEKYPAPHEVQVDAASVLAYVPGRQEVHALLDAVPFTYVPARQPMQLDCPWLMAYFPGSQPRHTDIPVSLAKYPGWHDVQTVADCADALEYLPSWHLKQ